MRLHELSRSLTVLEIHGSENPEIRGLAYDSRDVQSGFLFVAMPGQHTDGHRFVGSALERGAAAVLHCLPLPDYRAGVPFVRVQDSRLALSPLADAYYGHPSRKLSVIGVTGTDGKSTTVYLIHQLLERLGQASGFLSTVHFQTSGELAKNSLRQSTPEASEVHALLADMAAAGKRFAVLEATSHGLSERTGRLKDVRFRAAVCTNITHEHLEFHGTFERYRSDKANLFRALDRAPDPGEGMGPADGAAAAPDGAAETSGVAASAAGEPAAGAGEPAGASGAAPVGRFGVLNLDDPSHGYLSAQTRAPLYSYALRAPGADLWASDVRGDLEGSLFTLRWPGGQTPARLALPGRFNIENLLAASLAVHTLLGIPFPELASLFPSLRGVPGRMQPVRAGQPFRVIVDYAHTPEAFAKILPLLREHCSGRLIAVFGSAGERDVAKRSRQGEVASRYCDLLVLADEDPRGEDRMAILRDIASGCLPEPGGGVLIEPDRRRAVSLALSRARPEDTVLLLGKGHEESILYAEGKVPWNEAEVAREELARLGFAP
jgi:UDP-N-acetylmuramoyl-L-alanyl-D-glutamate--2,6-diaminopimelate ligase